MSVLFGLGSEIAKYRGRMRERERDALAVCGGLVTSQSAGYALSSQVWAVARKLYATRILDFNESSESLFGPPTCARKMLKLDSNMLKLR